MSNKNKLFLLFNLINLNSFSFATPDNTDPSKPCLLTNQNRLNLIPNALKKTIQPLASPSSEENLYSKTDKLRPVGALMLNRYLSIQHKNYQGYVVLNPVDLPALTNAKKDSHSPFVFSVLTGKRHWTPVIIDNQSAYILESLGSEKSNVGKNSITQIALALSQSKITSFFTTQTARQFGKVGCGTDCFCVLRSFAKHPELLLSDLKKSAQKALTQTAFQADSKLIIDSQEKEMPFFKEKSAISVFVLPALPAKITRLTENIDTAHQQIQKMTGEQLSNTLVSASDESKKENISDYLMRTKSIKGIPQNQEAKPFEVILSKGVEDDKDEKKETVFLKSIKIVRTNSTPIHI
jgi:hypothetical protein